MVHRMQKAIVWAMMLCFCIAAVPTDTFAAEHNRREKQGRGHQYDRRHERIIVNRIHINERHFGFARENQLTLRDLIIAKTIADESRYLDTNDVIRMKLQGKSYKKIAKKYKIKWKTIDRKVDEAYGDMRRDSLKLGLTLWALDEILN